MKAVFVSRLQQLMLEKSAVTGKRITRKAVEEAFAQSVLWGFTVVTEEAGKVLVDATDFLIQDVHDVVGSLRSSQQGSGGNG